MFHPSLRDVAPVWLAVALLTTFPYVVAAMRVPPGHRFTGVVTAYDDTFTYLAWIKQAAGGRLLFCDLYTSEAHACEFFLPLWLVLGNAVIVTGAPPILAFHAARLIAAFLLLLVTWHLARRVMKSRRRLRLTLWLYAFSGGLGWLVYLLNNRGSLLSASAISSSVDLNVPEAIAFRSAYAQVHFTLGAALVACAIALLAHRSGGIRRSVTSGLLVTVLALVHPYLVVVVVAVAVVVLALWPWLSDRNDDAGGAYVRAARVGVGFAAGALPGAVYLVYLNRSNQVLREWLRVTDTLSPPPHEYLLGFGLVAVLSVVGFKILATNPVKGGRFLLIWAIVQATLLYAPLSYQRRLIEGLQLPVCVAASVALFAIGRRLRVARPARKALFVALVAIASLTNIGFLAAQVVTPADAPAARDPRRYIRADLAAALDWLGANAQPDSVVFCSYLTGNLAPPMAGLRVYLGHYGQTLRSDEKGEQVTAFYRGDLTEHQSRSLLAQHRVSYVVYGPFERAISANFQPPGDLYLIRSFGQVRLFIVSSGD